MPKDSILPDGGFDELFSDVGPKEEKKPNPPPKKKNRGGRPRKNAPKTVPDLVDFRDFDGETEGDVTRDAKWVYDNLFDENVVVGDAPSRGAWGLLHWARHDATNQTKFFQQFVPKVQSEQEHAKSSSPVGVDLDDQLLKEELMSLGEVERLLKEVL